MLSKDDPGNHSDASDASALQLSHTPSHDYSDQRTIPFDSGDWDSGIQSHPDTSEPIFIYRVFNRGIEVGSATFYKHPLLCRSEDGIRHNILKLTGVLSEFDTEFAIKTVEDICEALPPTLQEQVTTTSIRGASHGAIRGVANTLEYGLKTKGYSERAARYAYHGMYYGSMFTMRYWEHYSHLDEDMPELNKLSTAAYQAAWDTGQLWLTNTALKKSSEAATWASQKAMQFGWTKTSRALGFFGRYGGYSVYAHDTLTRGPVHAAASLVSGVAAEKTVSTLGKTTVGFFAGRRAPAANGANTQHCCKK